MERKEWARLLLNLVLKHDGYRLLRLPMRLSLSASGLSVLFDIFRANLYESARCQGVWRQYGQRWSHQELTNSYT